jgi:hypothetical protein
MSMINSSAQSKEHFHIPAAGRPTPGFFLPAPFEEAILLHVVKNNLKLLRPPLFLFIQGPKGEGKSAQTLEACSRLSVDLVVLAGASLSGVHEKEPILLLHSAYQHALALREAGNRLVAVLIEDLDTSVASVREERRYTVNTQLLSGALMFLADHPSHLGRGRAERIPIICTGNDFTSLYEPITRHGRANFFDWKPDLETRIEIVSSLFEKHLRPRDLRGIPDLVKRYCVDINPPMPISFFHQVRDDIYDRFILDWLDSTGVMDLNSLAKAIERQNLIIGLDQLTVLCDNRTARKPTNHLMEK